MNSFVTSIRRYIIKELTRGLPVEEEDPGVPASELQNLVFDLTGGATQAYGKYLATSKDVFTCVTGRADLLSALPLRIYKKKSSKRELVTTGNLFDLLKKVNQYWTFPRLVRMTVYDWDLWGASFWLLERGKSRKEKPREIWRGRPDRVQVLWDNSNYLKGFNYTPVGDTDPIFYGPEEVVWIYNPDPMDDHKAISPLGAVRAMVDYSANATKSNSALFENGMQIGGIIAPKNNTTNISLVQAQELERQISNRFKGVDKAHRWGALRFPVDLTPIGMAPKDAEFINGQKMTLEDVCRVYKWPLDLVGGQRTYENFQAAMKAAYTFAVLPMGRFIADQIQEQLMPMFLDEAEEAEFDSTGIAALSEDETSEWNRAKEQLDAGVITINQYLESQGKPKVAWGDVFWASATRIPVSSGERPTYVPVEPTQTTEPERAQRSTRSTKRGMKYGSTEHVRVWGSYSRKADALEKKIKPVIENLLTRQKASVIARLKQGKRTIEDITEEPFDMSEWIKRFRLEIRPVLRDVIDAIGQGEINGLGIDLSFYVDDPRIVRAIRNQAQTFAQQVCQETWDQLTTSIAEGLDIGEGLVQIEERIEEVMNDRISSSSETIARTEVKRASTTGQNEAAQQLIKDGVKVRKAWLGALDDRIRESHIDAHERYQENPIDIDENFEVGGGSGPGPGQIGIAEEDINCRCTEQLLIVEEE